MIPLHDSKYPNKIKLFGQIQRHSLVLFGHKWPNSIFLHDIIVSFNGELFDTKMPSKILLNGYTGLNGPSQNNSTNHDEYAYLIIARMGGNHRLLVLWLVHCLRMLAQFITTLNEIEINEMK